MKQSGLKGSKASETFTRLILMDLSYLKQFIMN